MKKKRRCAGHVRESYAAKKMFFFLHHFHVVRCHRLTHASSSSSQFFSIHSAPLFVVVVVGAVYTKW